MMFKTRVLHAFSLSFNSMLIIIIIIIIIIITSYAPISSKFKLRDATKPRD